MIEFPPPTKRRRHGRSWLLIAAYGAMGVAFLFLVLGAGIFWTLSSAGMAVLLALAEVYMQLKRR